MTTVLIADDEVLELQYLCRLFEKSPNFQLVGQAGNGSQAVELASRYKPDIIIMDINMPMSGLEAAEVIRRKDPGQIIIINTAYANFEYARHAVELHLDAYLLKPATSEDVLSTVERCLRQKGRSSITDNISSIRAQLAYPHDIVETMLQSLALKDAALFAADSAAYIDFLDHKGGWAGGYNLFLINTVYSLGRQLGRLRIPDAVLELVDCEGYIFQLERTAGDKLRNLMEELFHRISLALQASEPDQNDPVEAVCSYIQNHFAQEISLNQLADITHFSPGYISRLFHRRVGVTLRNYISQIRVENASQMLQLSRKGVADIALDCGFRNLSHFYRVFKQHTGITPKEMRNREGKNES
mgnify:CR=1 FL=1